MTAIPEPDTSDRIARSIRPARWGVGAAIVLVVLAACVAVVIGMVRSTTAPVEDIPLPATTAEPVVLYVHVSGAVTSPGLYRLADDARLVDAVAAAGGLHPEADLSAVNLARKVSDGEQVHVPAIGEEPVIPPGAGGAGGVSGDGRINLNTADAAGLDTLPRIGPALAQRILDWRQTHGAFTSVEDLLAVPGIGEKMLDALRDLVTV